MFPQYESVVTGLILILTLDIKLSKAFVLSVPFSSCYNNSIINLAFPYNLNGNKKEFMNMRSSGGRKD